MVKELTVERVIHAAAFVLLLVGLIALSGWASHVYIDDWILKIAAIALSWGIILLILYVSFKKLGWNWWSPA